MELAFGQYGGAECFFHDIDADGRPEAVIYDRLFLWVYPLL